MEKFGPYHHQFGDIDRRAGQILTMMPTREDFLEICRIVLGCLDLTSLEGTDNEADIMHLCGSAKFSASNPRLPDAAAVCVYPNLAREARKLLAGTGIKVACVAGGFPSGQTGLKIKLDEIRYALDEGAEEIDTVISRGKLIAGQFQEVYDELAAIREESAGRPLKVILETGELETVARIRKAAELAISAGADFIKTSTGKIATGSTSRTMIILLDTIFEHAERTGKAIGIKAAGGIRQPDQAVVHYLLVKAILGDAWLNKDFFRIGASSLAGTLMKELA
jgi:deoxyribose-phosphate aldolase